MLVVADAAPVNVLVRIAHVDVLPRLFGRMVVPPAVVAELSHARTPDAVRSWILSQPEWLEVRSPIRVDETLDLDPGEAEAIALALELHADLLLVDDRRARRVADHLGVAKTGTVGNLEQAAHLGLLSLPEALARLRATDFSIAESILEAALTRDAERRRGRERNSGSGSSGQQP